MFMFFCSLTGLTPNFESLRSADINKSTADSIKDIDLQAFRRIPGRIDIHKASLYSRLGYQGRAQGGWLRDDQHVDLLSTFYLSLNLLYIRIRYSSFVAEL